MTNQCVWSKAMSAVNKLNAFNQLQRLLNRCKDIFFLRPFLPFWVRRLRGKGMIYLYHRIDNEFSYPFLNKGGSPFTSAEEFRQDIASLKSFGAEFIDFSEIDSSDFSNGFKVIICADDGFASCYQQAAGICQDESVPLTIFQCTAMIKGQPLIWEHQLYFLWFHVEHGNEFQLLASQHGWPTEHAAVCAQLHPEKIVELIAQFMTVYPHLQKQADDLAQELYPSVEEIQKFSEGSGEVASHGDRHLPRSSISQHEFEQELAVSKKKLVEMIGGVDAFSYPFDDHQAGDEELCKRHYSLIATVGGGFVDAKTSMSDVPRNTFPGQARNTLRHRRWLLTGRI